MMSNPSMIVPILIWFIAVPCLLVHGIWIGLSVYKFHCVYFAWDYVWSLFLLHYSSKSKSNFFKNIIGALRNSLNSRKTTSLESLSSRYQLVENIRTTKFVVPNILAYCITLIIHILLLMYANTKRFDSVIEFAVAKVSFIFGKKG